MQIELKDSKILKGKRLNYNDEELILENSNKITEIPISNINEIKNSCHLHDFYHKD